MTESESSIRFGRSGDSPILGRERRCPESGVICHSATGEELVVDTCLYRPNRSEPLLETHRQGGRRKAHSQASRFLRVVTAASLLGLVTPVVVTAQGTATISLSSSLSNNRLIVGTEGFIFLNVSAGASDTVRVQRFRLVWRFSNGNILGPLYDTGANTNVAVSAQAASIYESTAWNKILGSNATDPDTTLGSLVDFGGSPVWTGTGTSFVFKVIPTDTGSFTIEDDQFGAPEASMIEGNNGVGFSINWQDTTVQVIPCSSAGLMSGDCNEDSTHNASDIIYLVNSVFKSGPLPVPLVEIGDLNCSGAISASDIIVLVNFVFKSGNLDCDICSLL